MHFFYYGGHTRKVNIVKMFMFKETYRRITMKKLLLTLCITLCISMLYGCSTGTEPSAQSRTDLTAEHFRGLTSDMSRKDVEDLIGTHDANLASKESLAVYSLSDGSTAVLRYVDDMLVSAYIRGKDMFEETIFNRFDRNDGVTNDPDGSYDTENGHVIGDETNVPETTETNDTTSILDTENNLDTTETNNSMTDTTDSGSSSGETNSESR